MDSTLAMAMEGMVEDMGMRLAWKHISVCKPWAQVSHTKQPLAALQLGIIVLANIEESLPAVWASPVQHVCCYLNLVELTLSQEECLKNVWNYMRVLIA